MEQMWAATGGRKVSVARVILRKGSGNIKVNSKDIKDYFQNRPMLIDSIMKPLKLVGMEDKFDVEVKVHSGGVTGQAEAIRHGIARALQLYNPEFRPVLKKEGLLTRDARMKERKKYGLRKARRAPQFTKR